MAKKLMHLGWLMAILLVSSSVGAQIMPPPPTPPPPPPPGVPITEGIIVLMIGGLFYGVKKLKAKK